MHLQRLRRLGDRKMERIYSPRISLCLVLSFSLMLNLVLPSEVSAGHVNPFAGNTMASTNGEKGKDIGVLAALLVIVGVVATLFVTKLIISAATGRDAHSIGSVTFNARLFTFTIDDIYINANAGGGGVPPAPGHGDGFVTATGGLRFHGFGTQTLNVHIQPNLSVLYSNRALESGQAHAHFTLESPQLGELVNFDKVIKDGSFTTPMDKTVTFNVRPFNPIDINFNYRVDGFANIVPEPSSVLLLVMGMASIGILITRRGRSCRHRA